MAFRSDFRFGAMFPRTEHFPQSPSFDEKYPRMVPLTWPPIVNSSATTSPTISADSPARHTVDKPARMMVPSATARELRFPDQIVFDANQPAGLKAIAHTLKFLALAFGVSIEYAADVKLFAPSVKMHNDGAGR